MTSRALALMSISINATVDKIAYARLVYQDGDAASGEYALLSEDQFPIGATVQITTNQTQTDALFEGIVTGYRVKVKEGGSSQLIIDCRHAAFLATELSKLDYFEEQKSIDIIEQKLNEYRLDFDINDQLGNDFVQPQNPQLRETDWEFCLQLANRIGMHVFTRGKTLSITSPDVAAEPTCNLEFGATVINADLHVDARLQLTQNTAKFWDKVSQVTQKLDGQAQINDTLGDKTASSLAEAIQKTNIDHMGQFASEQEAQVVANCEQNTAILNKLSGTITTIGMEAAMPGDVVAINGFTSQFNGNGLVTGVRHEYNASKGWRTYLQFGGLADLAPIAQRPQSLMIGKVVDLEDPDSEFRVKVSIPLLDDQSQGIWARVTSIDAGDERGLFSRPEVGDEVIVGFIGNDLRDAAILGVMHSSAHPSSEAQNADNNIKAWRTKTGMELKFDDDIKALSLSTESGSKLVLTEDEQGIKIEDENGNQVVMDPDGISVSASNLKLDVSDSLELNANSIELNANSSFTLGGSAGLNLQSSGIVEIKGSLVKIN